MEQADAEAFAAPPPAYTPGRAKAKKRSGRMNGHGKAPKPATASPPLPDGDAVAVFRHARETFKVFPPAEDDLQKLLALMSTMTLKA